MCKLDFDVIGKQETAEVDVEFIMARTGWNITPSREHASSGGSSQDLAREYFRELDSNQVQGLIDYYRFDLEAFEYDPYEYIPGE